MLSPLDSTDGMLVTAAIRDISVRKAAETHLAQMEGRYRGLLEAAPDAMVVVDQTGEIVLLNVQAEKQFGYRRDELLGQKVTNIIPEGFAERLIADDLRSAEDALGQQIGTGIELNARRKDGSGFPIEIMLSPLESPDGHPGDGRDPRHQRAQEGSSRASGEECGVESLQRRVGTVRLHRVPRSAGAAPHGGELHAAAWPGATKASWTMMPTRSLHLQSTAPAACSGSFRTCSRFRALARAASHCIRYPANTRCEQAIRNLRGSIDASGALVTHDPLPEVIGDEMQLTQLFQNLVGNAIKYQNQGVPNVHIGAVDNGEGKYTFSVHDNGIGIDPQYFDKIFGMFQRLHKRDEFNGTGIGLAICKKIVERHGGRISVQSQPGHGSTFSFALAGK